MKSKSVRLFVALVLLGSLVAAVLPVGTAGAATLCVNPGGTGGCYASITAAVAAANPAGGDTIVVAEGTYNENNIQIAKSLTIEGAGPGATIVDGGAGDRVFWIGPGSVVAMSGMTIRNGGTIFPGGGVCIISATVTLTNCTISGNSAGVQGGGINAQQGATVTVRNCTVSGNSATSMGGGIMSHSSTLTMDKCTVSGNRADHGAGVLNNGGPLTMTNCTVSGNTATYTGGILNLGTLTTTDCTISGNSGASVGGIWNQVTLTMTCTIVYGNTAASGPGDIYNLGVYNKTESIVGEPDGDPDPLLGPLQHNGGPTETHALLEGSPAIDACVNNCTVTTDQRGVHRPQREYCDIGAFELPPLRPPTVPALSLWGIGGMAVVLALFLAWSLRRRRSRAGGPR